MCEAVVWPQAYFTDSHRSNY